jgi:6-phosphogluconate dehydrogenase
VRDERSGDHPANAREENAPMTTTLGMIGLGRMGANMSRRLTRSGLQVVAWDRDEGARNALADEPRVDAVETLAMLVARLPTPRIVWLMLPAGLPTESTLQALQPLLAAGDVVVDGANAMYRDSQRHALELGRSGVLFVDAGVSGGVWGLDNGYGLMVGGTDESVGLLEPVLRALAPAPDRGWVHCGPAGAGHYAKMVHNGIEYGMMQAYAEGLALLRAKSEFDLDIAKITEAWRHGTVIRSWLLDLTAEFLAGDAALDSIAPFVADSGEGRWTALESIELGVPTPVMTIALMERFSSQGRGDFAHRLLARMRQAFGGHAVKAKG